MFRCRCTLAGCNYHTMFDMTEGVAVNAATMHSMLGDTHVVLIETKDGGEIVIKHTVTKAENNI